MSEDLYAKFVDQLLQAVDEATDEGRAARLTVGGNHDITIDIYKSKAQMKVFDEMALDLAKKHRGIGVVKP